MNWIYCFLLALFFLIAPQSAETSPKGKSSSATVELLTEALIQKHHLEEFKTYDIGFAKRLLSFHDIPGDPPYSLQIKRPTKENPDVFEILQPVQESSKIAQCKKEGRPFSVVISSRGFLPGEKFTVRLCSKDPLVFREIEFFPRPLGIIKPSGEILMIAELKGSFGTNTFYQIKIVGVAEDESYTLISYSENEVIPMQLKGPLIMSFLPAVVNKDGGVCRIELTLLDKSSYRLDLPWGSELNKYCIGEK